MFTNGLLQKTPRIRQIPCSDGGLQEQVVSNVHQEVTKPASSRFCPFACSWRCPSRTPPTEGPVAPCCEDDCTHGAHVKSPRDGLWEQRDG